jgi:GxxExxY protein
MQVPAPSADALNQLTSAIIGAAIEVHRNLGPGLLESAYRACLCYELRQLNLRFKVEQALPLVYKGVVRINRAYTADLIVESVVIVELKALPSIPPVCRQQLLTYLRLTDCRVGLLLNFGAQTMTAGIDRVVYRFPEA